MKRFLITLLLPLLVLTVQADDILYIFHRGGELDGVYAEDITDMRYSHWDLDSVWHDEMVVQEIWTADTVMRYSLAEIDSITFKKPETRLQPNVMTSEDLFAALVKHEGTKVYFDSSRLNNVKLPSKGTLLCQLNTSPLLPNGFAGRVTDVYYEGNNLVLSCSTPRLEEVFERLVYYGEYDAVETGDPSAPLNIKPRPNRAIDIYINKLDSLSLGSLDIKKKFKMESINTTVTFDGKFEHKFKLAINIAYSAYYQGENYFFVHYGPVFKGDLNMSVAYGVKDDDTQYQIDGKLVPTKDEDGRFSLTIAEQAVPIPNFPIVSVGIKTGLFLKPELTAMVKATTGFKFDWGKTFILKNSKLQVGNRNNYCDGYWTADGTLKGGLWAGLSFDCGIGITGDVFTEKVKIYIGPAVEGELKLNIKDVVNDVRPYNFLKDSQARTGVRLEAGLSLSANDFIGHEWDWSQIKYEPKEWIFEHQLHLVPKFSPIEYEWHGNTLVASTEVSRNVFPSKVGIVLRDETGKETVKYANQTYFLNESFKNPLTIAFDNLDPKKHIYSLQIVDTPCLTSLEMNVTDPVWATCPDSHHPHALDLNLPSGTKWSCCKVGAKHPGESSPYYALGNIKANGYGMSAFNGGYVTNPEDGTYLSNSKLTGTIYDPAKADIGDPWAMPSIEQLDELVTILDFKKPVLPSFSMEPDLTPVLYARAYNGDVLVLPCEGYRHITCPGRSDNLDTDAVMLRAGLFPREGGAEEDSQGVLRITASGAKTLSIADNDGVQILPVVGPVDYQVYVDPEVYTFEKVVYGQTSEQTFTIHNKTDKMRKYNLSLAYPEGCDSKPFSLPAKYETVKVPADGKASFTVSYTPSSNEESTNKVTVKLIPSDAALLSLRVGLFAQSLTQLGKLISLDTDKLDFGEVLQKKKGTKKLNITNNSEYNIFFKTSVINDASTPGVFFLPEEEREYMLEPGKTVGVNVTFSSEYKGIFEGTLIIEQIGTGDVLTCHLAAVSTDRSSDLHNDFVDLGLPSGVLWAKCNLGAASEEEYGDYYAWGETDTKDVYSWSTYKHYNTETESITKYKFDDWKELLPEDDVATLYGDYHTPSYTHYEELIDNTTQVWTARNGVYGWLLTSKINGNTIFFPAAGYIWNIYTNDGGEFGYYWMNGYNASNEIYGKYFEFTSSDYRINYSYSRCAGMPVRTIYIPALNTKQLDFGEMGYHVWDAREFTVRNDNDTPMAIQAVIDGQLTDGYGDKLGELRLFAKTADRGAVELTPGEAVSILPGETMTFWTSLRLNSMGEFKGSIKLTSNFEEVNAVLPVSGSCDRYAFEHRFCSEGYQEPVLHLNPGDNYGPNVWFEVPYLGEIIVQHKMTSSCTAFTMGYRHVSEYYGLMEVNQISYRMKRDGEIIYYKVSSPAGFMPSDDLAPGHYYGTLEVLPIFGDLEDRVYYHGPKILVDGYKSAK